GRNRLFPYQRRSSGEVLESKGELIRLSKISLDFSTEINKIKRFETFEKCSILVKIKKGENFNHRNI
ncbi:MAG: hypothetical protein V1758_17260, partial [Pseudomonadota bacterium]